MYQNVRFLGVADDHVELLDLGGIEPRYIARPIVVRNGIRGYWFGTNFIAV